MDYVRLGDSGLRVSRICLGMMSLGDPGKSPWHLDEERGEPIVRRAVEAGVTFFDTADMYAGGVSEEITGSLLRKLFDRRDDYVLATKVFFPTGQGSNDRGLSRKHINAAIDASLRRLGTDHVDLYQLHRWDYETPIEETLEALHDLVRAGKVRYLGATSMFAWQLAKAQYTAQAMGLSRLVSMQSHYNLLYREEEREMIPFCADEGIGVVPWSPLARGRLAGNRERGTVRAENDRLATMLYDDGDQEVVDVVGDVARARGLAPAQVALAWLLSRPAVVAPTIGATRTDHIDDAVSALDVTLDDDELARLEAPYRPHEILGHE
ncbi:aldo/keto reductase [Prauserella cavernicola]|uniref:Aldo/keto reductase n=1 Tax=Prauserella cavernicola TaxID=2800127 RepID=A0A934QZ02_9PSEU|nr:aldo/keto reductase [Prauserella cavernicola]MBK1787868.1 aldo/keto reductase [Prauserella cavernicola]